ncbi:hypothetical protein [Trinickia mobilis]|uniref:hypothetical protein n=1 Tax=Trinickia mobilis TaxID=2816356 RepID=UPI001A8E64AB|nr:hypothetical protein [Trinickia mobilis]
MNTSPKITETEFWNSSRDIVHFVGICGAGKSTLSNRLAARIATHGGKVIGTVDYDPHTPDTDRAAERAFSRDLDRRNIAAGCTDPAVHQEIVDHTLATLTRWMDSDANVVLVDRWYESYDLLPADHIKYIEAAISSSGFRVHHVLLLVEGKPLGNEDWVIRDRLLHTKGTRPAEWWSGGPGDLEVFVKEEQAYQEEYGAFLARSPFNSMWVRTTEMEWERYEQDIVQGLIYERWKRACSAAREPDQVALEKSILTGLTQSA